MAAGDDLFISVWNLHRCVRLQRHSLAGLGRQCPTRSARSPRFWTLDLATGPRCVQDAPPPLEHVSVTGSQRICPLPTLPRPEPLQPQAARTLARARCVQPGPLPAGPAPAERDHRGLQLPAVWRRPAQVHRRAPAWCSARFWGACWLSCRPAGASGAPPAPAAARRVGASSCCRHCCCWQPLSGTGATASWLPGVRQPADDLGFAGRQAAVACTKLAGLPRLHAALQQGGLPGVCGPCQPSGSSDGPAVRAGDQFALYEAVVALAMLARRFNFAMAPAAPAVGMTTVRTPNPLPACPASFCVSATCSVLGQ